jgi:predicted ATPase
MLEVATEFGLPGFRAEGEFLVAWAEGGREALAVMREALESRFAVGQIVGHSLFQSLLAEDLLRHEDVAAARRLVDEGFAYAEKTGELRHVSDLHRLAGECSAREGDRKQAAESYRRALEVARQQGARLCELRALSALARLPAERRRQRQRLAETCEWFGDTVQSVDLAEARLLLSPAGADYS